MHPKRVVSMAAVAVLAVVLAACSGTSTEPTRAVAAPTATTEPASNPQFASPEDLAAAVVQAIRDHDEAELRMVWPPDQWGTLGLSALNDFTPSSSKVTCERLASATAWCPVFADDLPFVLELTMEPSGGGWRLTGAALDSTD